MKEKKKLSLAMQIFIALVPAIIAGLLMQSHADFAESYIKPFGTIFLNLVKFIVVPIVLFSIMCGIISMSDIKKVGAIGLKTVIFYLCTTAFAVTIGLTGGNLFKVVIGGASDSQEQCGCSGYDGYRKCDVCGRVSKHSYALADEDLVNDVVQSAD